MTKKSEPVKLPRELKITLKRGGSGKGHHYWDGILACGACHTLNELAKANNQPTTFDGLAVEIGFLFHAFMELYYTYTAFEPSDVQIIGKYDEQARVEAERLIRWYMVTFPNWELGRVLGAEVMLPPENFDDDALIREFFNVEYTALLDLVVKISKRDQKRIASTRDVEIPRSGIWLVDHKTEARDDFHDRLIYSRQFTGQMLLWDLCHPKTPCEGVLINVVVKAKEIWSRLLVIDKPTEEEKAGLLHRLERAAWLHKNTPTWVNDRNCFPYSNRPCLHFSTEQCDRSPITSARLEQELIQLGRYKRPLQLGE